MVGKFSYLDETKLSLHTLCLSEPVYYGDRVGNRYIWQGGQTENHGGQTKNFSGNLHRILSNKIMLPTLAWNHVGALGWWMLVPTSMMRLMMFMQN